jgi:hypothetical protein
MWHILPGITQLQYLFNTITLIYSNIPFISFLPTYIHFNHSIFYTYSNIFEKSTNIFSLIHYILAVVAVVVDRKEKVFSLKDVKIKQRKFNPKIFLTH